MALDDVIRVVAVAVAISGLMLGWASMVRRWKRNLDVSDDPHYVAKLTILSEGSERRSFDPYRDIEWEAPEFAITDNDPRWVLSAADAIGRHRWYREQPLDKQIAIGMWRHANTAKVALHFENVLIRGLMSYTFIVPNGSPEYRYCLHEATEECNHTAMFQETVNRIGVDVPGMPRWLRWLAGPFPLVAGALPNLFFFAVLAGEVPIDVLQTAALREDQQGHPLTAKIGAMHVAEEARHISFAHEYLRKRVPRMLPLSRLALSLYVPIIMRVLCQAVLKPPRGFFTEFAMPRSVRKELFFGTLQARQTLSDNFGDVRMLCHEVGMMNPLALLMWRLCKINGRPSRYRGEPQRAHLIAHGAAR